MRYVIISTMVSYKKYKVRIQKSPYWASFSFQFSESLAEGVIYFHNSYHLLIFQKHRLKCTDTCLCFAVWHRQFQWILLNGFVALISEKASIGYCNIACLLAVGAYLANGPCREWWCNGDLDEQGNDQIRESGTKDDWKHSKKFTTLELTYCSFVFFCFLFPVISSFHNQFAGCMRAVNEYTCDTYTLR